MAKLIERSARVCPETFQPIITYRVDIELPVEAVQDISADNARLVYENIGREVAAAITATENEPAEVDLFGTMNQFFG